MSNATVADWLLTTKATNNPDIKSHSYKNPCQSNSSDYCSMVWDAPTAKDAFQLLMGQHQTDTQVQNDHIQQNSVIQMFTDLQLCELV